MRNVLEVGKWNLQLTLRTCTFNQTWQVKRKGKWHKEKGKCRKEAFSVFPYWQENDGLFQADALLQDKWNIRGKKRGSFLFAPCVGTCVPIVRQISHCQDSSAGRPPAHAGLWAAVLGCICVGPVSSFSCKQQGSSLPWEFPWTANTSYLTYTQLKMDLVFWENQTLS